MYIPRVKIIINKKDELEIKDVTDLEIKLNRIVDELQTPDKKYFEYSFSLTLPYTKTNAKIFNHVDSFDKANKFTVTDFDAIIYINTKKIFDGIIRLTGLDDDGFNCTFYSKAIKILDRLKEKKLNEINIPSISWNYESTIRTYCNNNYSPLDNTGDIQFPMIFYRTQYLPRDSNGGTGAGIVFTPLAYSQINCDPEYNLMLWYNTQYDGANIKRTTTFYHQFPPAVFVYSVLKYMFQDAGWGIGGSWMEMETSKRLILPFVGDNSVWDKGNGLNDDATLLYPAKFLPDMKQSDFLAAIINYFNIYPIIDIEKQTIQLETYNGLFSNVADTYDITDKVFDDTVDISPAETRSVTFSLKDDENNKFIMGLKRVNASDQPINGTYSQFDPIFDKYAETDDYDYSRKDNTINSPYNDDINIAFAETNMLKMSLVNYEHYTNGGTVNSWAFVEMLIPMISKQNLGNNEDNCFSEGTGTTLAMNTPATMKYKASPRLLIWHGSSTSTYTVKYPPTGVTGSQQRQNYLWVHHGFPYINFGTPQYKMKIQFASFTGYPNALESEIQSSNRRLVLKDYTGVTYNDSRKQLFNAHYAVEVENTIGSGRGTEYSLSLDSDSSANITTYNRFHSLKWKSLEFNEVFTADMLMDERDWIEMRVNRIIVYRDQLYRILKIEGYNPITRTATIQLNRLYLETGYVGNYYFYDAQQIACNACGGSTSSTVVRSKYYLETGKWYTNSDQTKVIYLSNQTVPQTYYYEITNFTGYATCGAVPC